MDSSLVEILYSGIVIPPSSDGKGIFPKFMQILPGCFPSADRCCAVVSRIETIGEREQGNGLIGSGLLGLRLSAELF
jgi:hypothetical protein